MIENRRVGIKSREVYECPAALALIMAHADLEDLTLERDVHHEKARLEPRWAELVYDGMWFSPLRAALQAFITESQRHVTGEVRLRFAAPAPVPSSGGAARSRSMTTIWRRTMRRTPSGTPMPRGSSDCGASGSPRGRPARGRAQRRAPGPAHRISEEERALTLWEGRISAEMADAVAEFTVSLPFDRSWPATIWPVLGRTSRVSARRGSSATAR